MIEPPVAQRTYREVDWVRKLFGSARASPQPRRAPQELSTAGVLRLSYENFDLAGSDRQRIVAFTAEPDSPSVAAFGLITAR